jgi:cyclopropane fatty-acyl-phospholipid synthase-like methyltransferase
MAPDQYPKWDYKEYPKSLAPDDLWGQVRRTLYGKPISEDQIQLIWDSIINGLKLETGTNLLDIGCGNGALAYPLFRYCTSYLGVDSSEYLISVAMGRFAGPGRAFICRDAVEFAESEASLVQFEKALCYGVFAYLSDSDAKRLLHALNSRFSSLRVLFLGSLPDRDRASSFYSNADLAKTDLDNHRTQIGVWRTHAQMTELATETGWHICFPAMSSDFYQSHYRYNAILQR